MTSKTDITVSKLVEMIQSGELSLPEMQRGYVWRAERVRDLLDSLYRGYPSGTILVWETEQNVPHRKLAIEQKKSPFTGHKLLLDGQQRLTSLSSILRGEPVVVHGQKKPIDILFNLNHPEGPPTDEPADTDPEDEELDDDDVAEEEEASSTPQERAQNLAFAKASQALQRNAHWIRVSDIFSEKPDKDILKRALPGGWDDPNHTKFTERLQKVRQIKNYIYTMQVLENTMNYEEVAEIFVRVNSRGVKLRSSDLALAQITSRWRDSLRLFEEFRDACIKKGFVVDVGLIVRALVVFATDQSRFKTVGSLTRDHLESRWEKTKLHVLWALDYLKHDLGVEHTALLSSPFLILTLAYYNAHQAFLKPEEARTLRRWFFFANARGRYSRGSTETFLDADLASIRQNKGLNVLLDALQRQVGRLDFTARDLAGSGVLSPILPAVYMALRKRGAVDLHTGQQLKLPDTITARPNNWHYLFPQQTLETVNAPRSEKKEIANMLFVSTPKGGKKSAGPLDKWLPKALNQQGVAAFQVHGLPSNPELYKPESYSEFLTYRRQALADLLNGFINDSPNTLKQPPLDITSLITQGECDVIEFKERAIDDDGKVMPYIAKEVTSFLNSKGGTLLIGVSDKGAIVGTDTDIARLKKGNRDGYLESLTKNITQRIGKFEGSRVSLTFHSVTDQTVLIIEVPKGTQAAYLSETEQGKPKQVFYIRAGNMCQLLDGKDAEQYIKHQWST